MNGVTHSIAKLLLRFIAWFIVAYLGVSAEVGDFIANDPDVVFLTSIGVGIGGMELLFGLRKLWAWWKDKPQPVRRQTADNEDNENDGNDGNEVPDDAPPER